MPEFLRRLRSMKKFVLLVLALALLVVAPILSCGSSTCEEQACTTPCTKEWRPVCGCNGKTYGNACEATCHGIDDYSEGACS